MTRRIVGLFSIIVWTAMGVAIGDGGPGPAGPVSSEPADRHRAPREISFEELLTAADIMLVSARGAVATLPIAIAMASGLPIVSTVTYTTSELLEDRHTALMTPPAKPRLLARRILDLVMQRPIVPALSDEFLRDLTGHDDSLADFDRAQDLQRMAGHQPPAELELAVQQRDVIGRQHIFRNAVGTIKDVNLEAARRLHRNHDGIGRRDERRAIVRESAGIGQIDGRGPEDPI